MEIFYTLQCENYLYFIGILLSLSSTHMCGSVALVHKCFLFWLRR